MPTKIQAQDVDTTTEFIFSELALDNGSASLPALSFSSDPNTGIYRIGADTLGITTNGAARLQIDTNATLFGDAVELRLQRTSNGRTPSISIYDAFGGFRHHTPNSNAESTTVAHQWQCNNPSTNSVLATLLANGQWQYQDGSVSTPSISFLNDPDTGIYRPGANQILLTAGGAAKFGVDSAGGLIATAGYLQNDNGSAVAPSFSFHTDPDTGIFRLNTNQIGVTTGGVRAFFVGSDGSINMDAGHNINFDAGTAAAPGLRGGADPDTGIFLPGANRIGFSTGGVEHWEVTSAGDFSVVTTGKLLITDGTAGTPGLAFATDLDTGFYNAGTANTIRATVGGSQRMRIDSTGTFINTQIFASDGSASVPGYAFDLDTNTGFFRVTDGEIGIATNSASVWKFTASALAGNNNDAKIQAADSSTSLPAYSFFNDPDTGIYRAGSNSMGITAGAAQVAQFNSTGFSDGVRYTPLQIYGAQTFGGGSAAAMQFSLQSTASVSTTPVEIIGTEYGMLIVNGVTGGGAAIFTDFIIMQYGSNATVVASKNSNSPAARTYTLTSGDRLSLAMASGTYNIMCSFFRCPIR